MITLVVQNISRSQSCRIDAPDEEMARAWLWRILETFPGDELVIREFSRWRDA